MSGIERIAAERERQVSDLGYTPEHDDGHDGDLARAAAVFAMPYECRVQEIHDAKIICLYDLVWPEGWAYSKSHPPYRVQGTRGRIEELAKAGALIAAEIDRLERGDSDGSGAR